MAQRTKTTETATIKDGAEWADGADEIRVAFEESLAEVTMAKRLYEVWRTVGQLNDDKWDWSRQSNNSHLAWVAVVRACSPPVLGRAWNVHDIVGLLH